MVIFDQLRISDDGQQLYIDAHVNKADMFANVTLSSLVIKTANQVSEAAPELTTGEFVYQAPLSSKEAHLVLSSTDFNEQFPKANLSEDLLFVYITTTGNLGDCVPCRLDESTTLGVTFDENLLYQRVMGYTKELVAECSTPSKGFIDFILQWNAFKASVETEHYVSAINFYNMLFDKTSTPVNFVNSKGCGCHG